MLVVSDEEYEDWVVEHGRNAPANGGCLEEAARAFALSLAVWAPMAWLAGWF